MRHYAPTEAGTPFDLHVLGMPPAFVLSQDQTLRLKTNPVSRLAPPHRTCSTGTVTQDDPRNLSFEPCDSLRSLQDVLTDDPDLGPNRTSTVPPPAHPFSQSIHLSKIPQTPRRKGRMPSVTSSSEQARLHEGEFRMFRQNLETRFRRATARRWITLRWLNHPHRGVSAASASVERYIGPAVWHRNTKNCGVVKFF